MIEQDWTHRQDYVVQMLGQRAVALRFKDFVSDERPKLLSLCEHDQLILLGVYGEGGGRERLVGYCLLFSGAPTLHWHTRYAGISYSPLEEIKTRQMLVIYDDPNVRLLRFGVGCYDYLFCSRKQVDEQMEADLADHQQHQQFSRAWRDGM
ncbi:hypothetical protein LCGC14_0992490 [marine sediment metagenome]|uniref:Uncharacterized protein n=1 Tax=marine sediment metagenome TaxID=412755 RepID=A0A0F9NA21_9ZZZZ